MKCPLCDGTVVNGRCKECGMPYRNDEILYHLNESRSDHYRHASDKARKIMQTQGVGSLGKGSTGKAAGNRNTSSGREKIRPAKTKKHSKLGILWVINKDESLQNSGENLDDENHVVSHDTERNFEHNGVGLPSCGDKEAV